MLSRVAESLYWLNRYLERAENVARFIDVNLHLTLGESEHFNNQWRPLISTTGDDHEFKEKYGNDHSRENVLTFLLFDDRYENSVLSCIGRARENARQVRQVLPLVVWEQLNKFYHMVREAGREHDLTRIQDYCEQVRLFSHLLFGAEEATSSKNEAWHFARLGRMMERADKTSRILDVTYYLLLPEGSHVNSALDIVRWSALLQSASALAMYRRIHGKIQPQKVADFLIFDQHFSRSMHHCVLAAQQALLEITESAQDEATNQMADLAASMMQKNIEDVIELGMHEYIDTFQGQLNQVGNSVANVFFTRTANEASSTMSQQQG